jgi:hypothetical protein
MACRPIRSGIDNLRIPTEGIEQIPDWKKRDANHCTCQIKVMTRTVRYPHLIQGTRLSASQT